MANEEIVAVPDDDDTLLSQCRIETFRAGGAGGQHQNKTESGVRLVHLPTGVRSVAREERSQHRNRAVALERLREKLSRMNEVPTPRKPTKVPYASRKKRLEQKRRRGETKRRRRRPDRDG